MEKCKKRNAEHCTKSKIYGKVLHNVDIFKFSNLLNLNISIFIIGR